MDGQHLNLCLAKEDNKTLLTQFIHSCISEICCSSGPTYSQFFNIGWTEDEYNYIHKILLVLFNNPAVLHLDDTKMPAEFFHVPENVQVIILDCLKIRRDQLLKALAFNHSQKQTATMIDFDWRLKLVMGSSKMSSLKEPLLQLDLRVKEKDQEEILDIEMNREELDGFIKTLEAANV
ncbi:COMM domain-containing protein 8-like [Fopius arisanus]|uniref:COMM domain-containing protein 8-like n=1 Tax=Fopius arisanus TaxID=64838 RepID=A0A9R1UA74_9HYME|nr:PREDICTED: COMM domain-containing protein 8-like [Fopius arisanus]